MNKKAFTLIELLAVIVILAIISLIAVPIVINIINDSKISSDEQSVELYLDTAEKTITKKQLSNPNFNPDKCKILSNGDLECFKDKQSLGITKIEMKGRIPEKGTIELKNNKFKYKNIWFNNKKYYAIAVLLDDADNNNEISMGDKYSYRVNDKDTFNFYVLTEPVDGQVNLIMDRNICEDGTANYTEGSGNCTYQWYFEDNNYYGPVVAMEKMYQATKNWENVPNMDFKYEDEGRKFAEDNEYQKIPGYGTIETTEKGIKIIMKDNLTEVTNTNNQVPAILFDEGKPLKARLPKENEVTFNEAIQGNTRLKYWLVDNLEYSDNYPIEIYEKKQNIQGIYNYWLLSSCFYSNSFSNYVYNYGYLGAGYTSNYYGIRPVITVPIDDLN